MKLRELLQRKDLDFATSMGIKMIQMAFGDQDIDLTQLKQEYPDINNIFNEIKEENKNA